MAKPDKILAHELLGREVLNLQAGEVAGSVVDFGINREGKVQLIGVLPAAWYSGGRGIAPNAITFLTGDRLCIPSGDALQDFSPDGDTLISTDSGGQIYGKTVLLHDGEMLGELVDFRFNLGGDGKITDLLVLDGEQRRIRIPIEKISTIGKDYIIIERGAASADSDAPGEAAPFSGAAAVAPAPAAAEPESAAVPEPEPAPAAGAAPAASNENADTERFEAGPRAVTGSHAGRGRSRGGKPTAPAKAEPEADSVEDTAAAPVSMPEEEPAPAAAEAEDTAASLEPPADQPDSSATAPAATNLDAVFSVPASPGLSQGELLGPPAEEAVPSAPAPAEPEEDLFAARGLSVSKFDQKKLDFLRGKPAHRDIRDPDGIILVAQGETLDQPALVRIVEGGVLGEVFIEMTLKK